MALAACRGVRCASSRQVSWGSHKLSQSAECGTSPLLHTPDKTTAAARFTARARSGASSRAAGFARCVSTEAADRRVAASLIRFTIASGSPSAAAVSVGPAARPPLRPASPLAVAWELAEADRPRTDPHPLEHSLPSVPGPAAGSRGPPWAAARGSRRRSSSSAGAPASRRTASRRSMVGRGTLARFAQNIVRWELRAAIPAPAREWAAGGVVRSRARFAAGVAATLHSTQDLAPRGWPLASALASFRVGPGAVPEPPTGARRSCGGERAGEARCAGSEWQAARRCLPRRDNNHKRGQFARSSAQEPSARPPNAARRPAARNPGPAPLCSSGCQLRPHEGSHARQALASFSRRAPARVPWCRAHLRPRDGALPSSSASTTSPRPGYAGEAPAGGATSPPPAPSSAA